MLTFIRRRLLVILVIASIVIFGEIALASAIKRSQPLTQPPIKITQEFKNIPANPASSVEKNFLPTNPNSQEEQAINEFAWKVFVALNWPVDCQGKPLSPIDPQASDRNMYAKLIGQDPEKPRAWELYPSPKDLFLPNGATPPPLDKVPEDDRCLNDRAGSEIEYKQNLRFTETGELAKKEEFSEFEIASRKDLLDGYGELKKQFSVNNIDAANQIPLVDRQGNYVINEIRVNPVEYNQISENKWYDATNLASFKEPNTTKQFQLMCSKGYEKQSSGYCDDYQAEGAIEIKAVWRVFDARNSEQERAKYYTTKRKIVSDTGNILQEQAELGLIGFHIMHKTSQLGWIWSTFEHIDNAPSCGIQQTANYTLHSNECKTGNCQENLPYVKEPYLWHFSNQELKAVTLEGIAVKDQISSQICRISPISTLAKKQNEIWQKSLSDTAKSSVWQYYQLIGTQWLQHPELPYSQISGDRRNITPRTPPLTNVALEPYAQGVSCIVCHTAASLPGKDSSCQLMTGKGEKNKIKACADFSFLMDNARPSK